MSITAKLLSLQQTVKGLAKDASGQSGKAVYPYVSGNKVLSVVRPAMDSLGLLLLQDMEDVQTQPGSNGIIYLVTFKFTWIDVESGESLENRFVAAGMNGAEKGIGSACTYAERYYLMKTFHIATDEDDVDTHNYEAEQPQTAAQEQARMQQVMTAAQLSNVSLEQAIAEVAAATSQKALNEAWNKYKGMFGKDDSFILAVKDNPYNKKAHRSTKTQS